MAKKKKGFLAKLGFKSKSDKLAEDAAAKAQAQQLVDEKMAARMAAINAAALKSAREQDAAKSDVPVEISDAERAKIEAEEARQAEIQAARDVARAKQLAEEKARREDEAKKTAQKEKEAAAKIEAQKAEKAKAAKAATEEADQKAEAAAKKAAAEEEKKEEELAQKAAEEAAEEEALNQAKKEAEEAARRARVAEEKAARDIAEREAAQRKATEKAAEEKSAEKKAEEAAAAQSERQAEPQDGPQSDPQSDPQNDPQSDPQSDPMPKGGFFERISAGLRKSTSRMSEQVSAAFTKRQLDEAAIEELEDILLMSDLGIGVASKVTARLAEDKFDKQVTDLEIKIALADVISEILTPLEKPIVFGLAKPQIMLFVGVNGSGKTTTLGKIAKSYTDAGKKVLIAAADTFRAAAVEQLSVWGERASAPVMSAKPSKDGRPADAAGLVYDAIARAQDENFDILMIDTAGRLQNRTELMEELSKIIRVIQKQDPSAPHHCILVLDATVGQNALMQTEVFRDMAGVTGLIMTKLDGTAKGGVLVALADKYALPIHHIGIGERIEDLENFSAPVFAATLSGVADSLED